MCCHPMTARPRGPGAGLWWEPQDGGVLRSGGERPPPKARSLWLIRSASSSSSDSHSHSDPNRTQHLGAAHSTARHDSHRVHCHHQIGHIRKLKSYTVIFHRNLKTKYLPQKQTIEKSKHDKNGQRRLNTSTTLQKCKRWFCFRHLCFFFSCVGRGRCSLVSPHPRASLDFKRVSLLPGPFLGNKARTVHWSTVGQNGSYWLGGIT